MKVYHALAVSSDGFQISLHIYYCKIHYNRVLIKELLHIEISQYLTSLKIIIHIHTFSYISFKS